MAALGNLAALNFESLLNMQNAGPLQFLKPGLTH